MKKFFYFLIIIFLLVNFFDWLFPPRFHDVQRVVEKAVDNAFKTEGIMSLPASDFTPFKWTEACIFTQDESSTGGALGSFLAEAKKRGIAYEDPNKPRNPERIVAFFDTDTLVVFYDPDFSRAFPGYPVERKLVMELHGKKVSLDDPIFKRCAPAKNLKIKLRLGGTIGSGDSKGAYIYPGFFIDKHN